MPLRLRAFEYLAAWPDVRGRCVQVVRTGKVLFGAHIQVVVLDMVQHGVDTGDGRDTDGAGRQAGVPVSIVGAFHVQMIVVNSPEGEIVQGELHRRVGLQRHTGTQTVDVHAGHHRLFGVLAVSSSTMEARVTTSFGVNPAASAKRSLSLFQNVAFSFCMRFMKSSRLVFQYTSYVLG